MQRIEKTVFISYRRTNVPWALAVHQNLTEHGYDPFFDFQGIGSGDFESVILANIKARAHFIVLLTPSALERCADPGDWLRREIETALETRRNIVPLIFKGFDFDTPAIRGQLTGTLGALKRYNAQRMPAEFFTEAMERVRTNYLDVPIDAVLHPTSASARHATENQQVAANAAPKVEEKELTAQEWFEQGFKSTDIEEQIRAYTEGLRLDPTSAFAYNNRGNVRQNKGDHDGAMHDYEEALRIDPSYALAYSGRGILRQNKGDHDGAIQDYTEAIRLNPTSAFAYNNRGNARQNKDDLDGALQDYTEALRLDPTYAFASTNRELLKKKRRALSCP